MPRPRRLLSGIRLAASHLADHNIVGVKTERHIQQIVLRNGFAIVLRFTRDRMHDLVQNLIVLITHHQVQLTGAAFNRKNSLVVGDSGQQPTRQCGFARRSRSRNSCRNAVTDECGKQLHHFIGSSSRFDEIFLFQLLRVDDTDRSRHADIFVHQRSFQHSNADIFTEMPKNSWRGIIQNHSRNVQHSAHYIDCMIGRLEFLNDFYIIAVAVLNFDVIPGIYVDFLNACAENIFCKERKLRHFGIQLIHKLRLRQPLNGNAVVEQILADIPLDLQLHLVISRIHIIDSVDNERGIFA